MRASVLVCTRNRAGELRETLATILADGSTVEREVVVVDNGSSDGTAEVARSFGVRYAHEPRTGIANARNRAVHEARGEILLFADDDVSVSSGWADALVAGFDTPDVVAVAGRVLPAWPGPVPKWLDGPQSTMLSGIDFGAEPRVLEAAEEPPSMNLGLRADALAAIGGFEPRLGHSGRLRVGHEETHLVKRLRSLGPVAYQPDALVHHRVDSERMNLDWMRSSFFQLGVGLGRRSRLEGEPMPTLPRRAVRAARLLRAARAHTRRNDRAPRLGPETWDELYAYMWAGLHTEWLVGRSPRLSDWMVRVLG
jgi:glycosyltransferase involved in cell wall biosynthesis